MQIPEELTTAERRLWQAIQSRTGLNLSDEDPSEPQTPREGFIWDEARTIRAETLIAILDEIGSLPDGPKNPLRLASAYISGSLALEGVRISVPMVFVGCLFGEPLNFNEARAPKLALTFCEFPAFVGNQLDVRGDVSFAGSRAKSIRIDGARIGGNLILKDTRLNNIYGCALSVAGAQIEGGTVARALRASGQIILTGSSVGGLLDFSGARIKNFKEMAILAEMTQLGSMFLHGAYVDGAVCLIGAHIRGQLSLNGAHLTNSNEQALIADGAHVDGGMFCRKQFRADGALSLAGAKIGVCLDLDDSELNNPGATACDASRAEIAGGVRCAEGFRMTGELNITGAQLNGDLEFDAVNLSNPGGCVIAASFAEISGSLRAGVSLHAVGELDLDNIRITGELDLRNADLLASGEVAISADSARIGGDLHLSEAHVRGLTYLYGADIGGLMLLAGTTLVNRGDTALDAQQAHIGRGILCDGLHAEGGLHLPGANITGPFDLRRAMISHSDGVALRLIHATVTYLRLPAVNTPEGLMDLGNACITHIDDAWPHVKYKAVIDDLKYEMLDPLDEPAGMRCEWLSVCSGVFRPQPYEQLAGVLRQAGQDGEARRVAMAKERGRRKQHRYLAKLWGGFLGAVVGYGYKPGRGLWWLGGLAVLDCIVFAWAKADNEFRAVRDKSQTLPQFHLPLFAVDHVLPVIELGQRSYWSASGPFQYWQTLSDLGGWILVTVILGAVTSRLVRN